MGEEKIIREYVGLVMEDLNLGAGFIVVRYFPEGIRVLALEVNGKYDLPKGRADITDNNILITAVRECQEESGILIFPQDMKWGFDSINLNHLTIFLAMTERDPIILPNPHSGIYEHERALWLTWDEIKNKIYPYLATAIDWAESKISAE